MNNGTKTALLVGGIFALLLTRSVIKEGNRMVRVAKGETK